MTEKETAHPTTKQLNDLTSASTNGDLVTPISPTTTSAPNSFIPSEENLSLNNREEENKDTHSSTFQTTEGNVQPPEESITKSPVESIPLQIKVIFKNIKTVFFI